jgi:hypothetical protein
MTSHFTKIAEYLGRNLAGYNLTADEASTLIGIVQNRARGAVDAMALEAPSNVKGVAVTYPGTYDDWADTEV